jgi:hypothetical protein
MLIKTLLASILMIVATFQATTAQTTASANSQTVTGKWAGSFDGAASGKFELVLNQDSNGKLTGQVIMLTDDGNRYPIDLKTAVWEKEQLSASYADPSDGDEVSFTGKVADSSLKGTWKSDGGQSVGTWQVSRAK